MSYVPDYVRPVCRETSALQVNTGVNSSGIGPTRKTSTLPTSPNQGVSFRRSYSPGEETTRRISQAPGYVLSRTWRPPQERLCGRLSIKDRLKSLESDADVKLSQVTSPSPKTKKWMARRDSSSNPSTSSQSSSTTVPPQTSPVLLARNRNPSSENEDASSNSSNFFASSVNHDENQFCDVPRVSAALPVPTPDIIESHRPKDHHLTENERISETSRKFHPDAADGVRKDSCDVQTNNEQAVASSGKGVLQKGNTYRADNQTNFYHVVSNSDVHVPDSGCVVDPAKKGRRKSEEREKFVAKMHKSSSLSNLDSPTSKEHRDPPCRIELNSNLVENNDVRVSERLAHSGKEVCRSFSLLWKPPCPQTVRRLDAGQLPVAKDDGEVANVIKKSAVMTSSVDHGGQIPQVSVNEVCAGDEHDESQKLKGSAKANSSKMNAPVMLNIRTATTTVPVELRSPRSEHGNQDKRNARVFFMPSSDSDSDNPFVNFTKHVWGNPGVLGAPDVVLSTGNAGLPLKHVSPVKFVPSLLKKEPTNVKTSGQVDNRTQAVDDLYPELSRARAKKRHSSLEKSGTNVADKREKEIPLQHNREVSDHRRKTIRSLKRGESRSKSSDTRMSRDFKRKDSRPRHRSNSMRGVGRPSPQQEAVARAVKFGNTDDSAIPFIDDAVSPSREPADEAFVPSGVEGRPVPQLLPLGVDVHGKMKHISPRRISYMEAMESSGDLTPDIEDAPPFVPQRSRSGRARAINPEGPHVRLLRSNSADSVLSVITNGRASDAKVLRRASSLSTDRRIAKKAHRRSYQIATRPSSDSNGFTTPKRQPSIRKLKNFFGESTPQIIDAAEEAVGRKGRRNTDSTSLLILDDSQTGVLRSGYLYFKVATIEKGKRKSSQKSWKLVWAVLKEQYLYLCKDWNRSKNNQITSVVPQNRLLLEEEEPLSVRSSLVGIAYNYVKRRNVFKLTTFNGSEYLFQAESRDDMLAWISAIQEESVCHEDGTEAVNEDLILKKTNQIELGPKSDKRSNRKRSPKPSRRHNLQVKDVDGSRRFKWRGSVNKIVKKFGAGQPFMPGGTFGVHLEDCPMSPVFEFVPFVVALCCRIVEERGLNFTGIYRVPGNSAALSSLQDDFNMLGVEAIDPLDDRLKDVNVVSSLLKSFFRKLPDPLFTNELYDDFIQGNRRPTPYERLNGLRRLVHMLPGPHYETLKFLITHLRRIADNCSENKMEVRNLAIVFGPTLVRSTASNNMATMVTDMSDQCRIVESIIEHATWFFLDTESDIPHLAPWMAPVDTCHEPVPSIGFLLDNVGRLPGDTSGNTSDSSKSKCSNESEKDSFSRDVIDLLFGKKWKQMGGRNHAQTEAVISVDEHGGFEDPQRKTSWIAVAENSGLSPLKSSTKSAKRRSSEVTFSPSESPTKNRAANVAEAIASKGVVDVSRRLYEFYQEHLDRLSKTNIGQPLPTFSSTESSPQITPKNSCDSLPLFSSQSINPSINRKPPDPPLSRHHPHVAPSHVRKHPDERSSWKDVPSLGMHPSRHVNEPTGRSLPVMADVNPQANPYTTMGEMHKACSTQTISKAIAGIGNYQVRHQEGLAENESKNSGKVNKQIHSGRQEHFMASGVKKVDSFMHFPRADPSVGELTNESQLPKTDTESLKLPPPACTSTKKESPVQLMSNSDRSSAEKSPPSRKTAQELYAKKRSQRQQQKRRIIRHQHQPCNPVPDENTFSRFDPKRRVIRSSSGELDPLHSVMNRVHSPPQEDAQPGRTLSAMERLFSVNNQPQQTYIKSFKRPEPRKNCVSRRHTLSGVLNFTTYARQIECSENSNPHGYSGLNLIEGHPGSTANSASLYDLSASCKQVEDGGHFLSAMDRLKPKGATSDLTLENWMVQERHRNNVTKRDKPMASGSTFTLTSSWNQRGVRPSSKSYV